ncbi:HSP20 family molecular chaperone IbpA [Evansella vedderi]|uniref:HSP20 family molecular chaperone IbpA n=1 Tax=Evansella vedderi TaxID=38282 RepID=A0ABT9ZQS5_9BACI|nr:Hsp20/alpha crystallin family protein [Evansella vedderi]MDQ0253593.1 HSP20 family molecular chaperone IbpA [Evansella vedderi]
MDWNNFDPLKYFMPKIDERNNMVNGIDKYVQNMLNQYLNGLGNVQTDETNSTTEDPNENPQPNEAPPTNNSENQNNNGPAFLPNLNSNQGGPTNPQAQANPSSMENSPQRTPPQSRVIELHGFIIIQILIPKHIDINDINVEHDATRIVVSGFPSGEPFEIKLPNLVRSKGGKAIFKKNILEIRLVKHEDDHLHPIPIRRK